MNLKKLREEKGISQSELAKNLGVVRSTICFYEKGQHAPTPEMLIKLADYFNVTVDYLIGHDTNNLPIYNNAQISNQTKNFVSEFERIFSDNSYIRFSRLFKAADNDNRLYITSFFEGMLFKAGYDTKAIVEGA